MLVAIPLGHDAKAGDAKFMDIKPPALEASEEIERKHLCLSQELKAHHSPVTTVL